MDHTRLVNLLDLRSRNGGINYTKEIKKVRLQRSNKKNRKKFNASINGFFPNWNKASL